MSLVAVPGTLSMPIAGLYEVLTSFPVVSGFHDGVPASSPFAVEIVGATRETVTAPSGLPIAIHRAVDEVPHTDIVIVPTMVVPQDWQRDHYSGVVDWMRAVHADGAVLCSACTGLLVLAETGLLHGRQATTHWSIAPSFRRTFPDIELCLSEVLVIAGEREEFAMAGGAASWQDLALYLIARFVNPAASQAIARFELLERHTEGQAPYLSFAPDTRHGDALVLELQNWLADNFAIPSPVAEMTRRSALSPRAFARRFRRATGHSPIAYVHHIRIEQAKRRLERTDAPVDDISWDVGYEDPAAFRRIFKRTVRLTPGAYRRKFKVSDFV